MSLRAFAERVDRALPRTAHGVRVAGDPDREVRTVAVLAGSGESLLAAARAAGADVVVTSDLKHHRAGEFLEDGGPALVDVAHWAAEWTWLPVVAGKVARATADDGRYGGDARQQPRHRPVDLPGLTGRSTAPTENSAPRRSS